MPVYATGRRLTLEAPADGVRPLFHALPADLRDPPATAVPLYEYVHKDTARSVYTTDKTWQGDGFAPSAQALCLVWRNPTRLVLPRE